MQVTQAAPETGPVEQPIAEITLTDAPDKLDSVRAAARLLAEHRAKKRQEAPAEVETQPELAPEANAAPEEAPPSGDTEEVPEPEETPPIEAPVSWTAENKERFAALPPDIQEYISNREKARDAEVRRSQNEAAEKLKAYEADSKAAQEQRQQYEAALPVLLQTLQSSGDFADIKTMDDVERLARDDWPRYVLWDAHQKKVTAVHQELQAAHKRQQQEAEANWVKFANEQDQKFAEAVPDISDPNKGSKLRDSALKTLKDAGYSEDELRQLWNTPVFRDHRMQRLMLDATRVREAREQQKLAKPKPVPPVQRPGTARAPGAEAVSQITALEQKLENARGNEALRMAAQLSSLRRKAASR